MVKSRIKLNEFLIAVGELFNKEISKILIKIYWEALKQYTDEQVEIAFKQIICKSRYFPKPVDIIEYIPKKEISMTPLEAWNVTLKWFEGGPQPIDPVLNQVVENLGGYEIVSRTPYPQLPWLQKDFERLYDTLAERRDIHELSFSPQKLITEK